MKKLPAFLNTLLHPPKWVFFPASPIVFSALIFIFAKDLNNSVPAYGIYCLSAYSLTILSVSLSGMMKKIKNDTRQKLTATKFGKRYLGDMAFRGSVNIFQGMTVNFFYVVFRIFIGIRYASVWSITMAVYYLVLGVLRLSLVIGYRHHTPESEIVCYRRTAWLLFLLNFPMSGMITLMVLTDSGCFYPGYVIYLSAMYTFYTVIMSIVNLVRFRRLGSPILYAAKVLNFVAALMSVLGLQTAMIMQFSPEEEIFRRMMNAVVGGFVWGGVIFTAVYMLFRSGKMEREVKSGESFRK